MRHLVLAVLLSLTSTAAQAFVVDINNGPGTDFVSLAAAVGGVPSGSTLIVRAGDYADLDIDAKALTVMPSRA